MKDNLHFDAQDKLKAGIDKVAKAVGSTMGTGGGNALIEAMEMPGHIVTNDGFSIANSIALADPIENMGRNLLVEAINRANKGSGDGSSTTCLLTSAIIAEGKKYAKEGHPMDIKRSLEECLPLIEKNLEEQSRQIVDSEGVMDMKLVEQVATISAEDAEIGARIAEIYSHIGPKGLIYWDISKTTQDSYTIGQGITVEGAGYMSPYMCDIQDSGQVTNSIRIKNALVLITKQKISTALDFEHIGSSLNGDNVKDLIVFADEVDPLVIPDLVKTRLQTGFRIIIVKMPVLWKDWWYEDLAKATGATVIDPVAGLPMKMLRQDHLGKVGNIVITKEDTYIDGIRDVSEYAQTIEEEGTDDAKLRASRLNTKTARYFVGAQSDSALSYRRLKVEDAISAAYQALNGGIVAGGGVALHNVATITEREESIGARILTNALIAPYQQILKNAGIEVDSLGWNKTVGYNTRTKQKVDMFEAGIVDPKTVVLNAVKNAISVAASVLTAPTVILLPRQEESNPAVR